MRNLTILILTWVLALGCKEIDNKDEVINKDESSTFFSQYVKDTFSIFVSLPNGYKTGDKRKYPVVYILDANLYFDILSVIIKKYADVGLLSSAVLVGIGYKNFQVMDSLRLRDYTYPVAIPEYEMSVSGRADKFLLFINKELIPKIDDNYKVDPSRRILMGHSLGGYFVLYALQQNLINNDSSFFGYVAASPSMHYNHGYLLNRFQKLTVHNNKSKVYVTLAALRTLRMPVTQLCRLRILYFKLYFKL